jgi:hypothetical protein
MNVTLKVLHLLLKYFVLFLLFRSDRGIPETKYAMFPGRALRNG